MSVSSRAFAITLRPEDGINDHDIQLFSIMIKKWKLLIGYRYIVEKHDSEAHIHCAVFLSKSITKDSLLRKLHRIYHDEWSYRSEGRTLWHVACTRGVRPMYNDDWYRDYLTKDNTARLISQKDISLTERQECYATSPSPKVRLSKPSDGYFHKLESLYLEWNAGKVPLITFPRAWIFLCDMMYKTRKLRVISKVSRVREIAHALVSYVLQDTVPNIWDRSNPYTGKKCELQTCSHCHMEFSQHDDREIFQHQCSIISKKRKREV